MKVKTRLAVAAGATTLFISGLAVAGVSLYDQSKPASNNAVEATKPRVRVVREKRIRYQKAPKINSSNQTQSVATLRKRSAQQLPRSTAASTPPPNVNSRSGLAAQPPTSRTSPGQTNSSEAEHGDEGVEEREDDHGSVAEDDHADDRGERDKHDEDD